MLARTGSSRKLMIGLLGITGLDLVGAIVATLLLVRPGNSLPLWEAASILTLGLLGCATLAYFAVARQHVGRGSRPLAALLATLGWAAIFGVALGDLESTAAWTYSGEPWAFSALLSAYQWGVPALVLLALILVGVRDFRWIDS